MKHDVDPNYQIQDDPYLNTEEVTNTNRVAPSMEHGDSQDYGDLKDLDFDETKQDTLAPPKIIRNTEI